ncbi:DUF3006 domain-containing protein [Salisediminibacterium halotolerans]|uniref:DUF3006 domain-containing protein n=1 Tax=Salisediminibacterium halotolerans TaxID=517425 RepID=UPI000F0EC6D9|nr:DUF3006 domain-containing protein [Salisediminibacterium halotolerans]RLJ75669.1 Protein of unknown function (DUF3006) [Actinophytocola xinjiangensis]RPE89523.1 DUF3006 family protein [Salisediminibacterium halotolerans]TWG36282.1 Protein of unknown function (DUF3006) [Salisediminibacterium halotolerans]GEL07370.1 hypothetical protein SHA02_07860 [Salisediminibacterium halotolerans]
MSTERKAHGVIDRIVDGGTAVILLEAEHSEIHADKAELPDGAGEGTHLTLTLAGNELIRAEINTDSETDARARVSAKMTRLRQKSARSRFKKDE